MDIAEQLQKLEDLHRAGALSDEEFAKAKDSVISGGAAGPAVQAAATPEEQAAASERQTRQWAMFLHLSLLAGILVPFAGLLLPIVIWVIKKDELPGIDPHGKMIVNWIISCVIYGVVSGLLILVIVGIPLLLTLCALGVIFPIIGAIKASEGVLWKYPLTITFLS